MRWNKKFDGTKASLLDKSRKPLSKHPNAHTDEELKWIQDYHRRTPKISVCELYGKLRTAKGYTRHPDSLYRINYHIDLTTANVVRYNGTLYNITRIDTFEGYKEDLTLYCKKE